MSINIQKEVQSFAMETGDKAKPLLFDKQVQFFGSNNRYHFVGNHFHSGGVGFVGLVKDLLSNRFRVFKDLNKEAMEQNEGYAVALEHSLMEIDKISRTFYSSFIDLLQDAEREHPYYKKYGVYFPAKVLENKIILPARNIRTREVTGFMFKKEEIGSVQDSVYFIGDATSDVILSNDYLSSVVMHQMTGKQAICYNSNVFDILEYVCSNYKSESVFLALSSKEEFEKEIMKFIKKKRILNLHIIRPLVDKDTIQSVNTFYDLYIADRTNAKAQLEEQTDVDQMTILGSLGRFIYINSRRNGLVKIPSHCPSDVLLLNVANEEYWQRFTKGPVVWKDIATSIQSACSGLMFDSSKIFKAGAMLNSKNEVVVNTGEKIIGDLDKGISPIFKSNRSRFSYPNPKEHEYSPPQNTYFLNHLSKFSYKNEYDYLTLYAWLMLAPVFNCLKFRPHLLLTGESGSGKTFIISLIKRYLKSFNIREEASSSSYAGIVNKLDITPSALILNERKDDKSGIKDRDKLLSALRETSTDPDATITKAHHIGGGYDEYSFNTIAVIASTAPMVTSEEDVARCVSVQKEKKEIKADNFKAKLDIERMDLDTLAKGNFAYVVENFYQIKSRINNYEQSLSSSSLRGHAIIKLATIFAFVEHMVTGGELKKFIDFSIENETARTPSDTSDILSYMMNIKYNKKHSIRDILAMKTCKQKTIQCEYLSKNGVLIDSKFVYLRKGIPFVQFLAPFNYRAGNKWRQLLLNKYSERRKYKKSIGAQFSYIEIPIDDVLKL